MKILIAFMFLCAPPAFAESQNLTLIQAALTKSGDARTRAEEQLFLSREPLSAEDVLKGFDLILILKDTKKSAVVARYRVLLHLEERAHQLSRNQEFLKAFVARMARVKPEFSPKSAEAETVLSIKANWGALQMSDLAAVFKVIRTFGVERFGPFLEPLVEQMDATDRANLKAALLPWFEFGMRNAEAQALVYYGLADQVHLVGMLRRFASRYAALSEPLPRLYFPLTAYVPAFKTGITRAELEEHIVSYIKWNRDLPQTAMAEMNLNKINVGLHNGDADLVAAVREAEAAGPLIEGDDRELYQEFFARLKKDGFTVRQKPPVETVAEDSIINVDFALRKKNGCEGKIRE